MTSLLNYCIKNCIYKQYFLHRELDSLIYDF